MKPEVTKAMISAAHEVTMRDGRGFFVSWQTLTEIYQAMHAAANGSANQLANQAETSSSLQDLALIEQALKAFEWNMNTDLDNIPACEQWVKMLKTNIAALSERIGKQA